MYVNFLGLFDTPGRKLLDPYRQYLLFYAIFSVAIESYTQDICIHETDFKLGLIQVGQRELTYRKREKLGEKDIYKYIYLVLDKDPMGLKVLATW